MNSMADVRRGTKGLFIPGITAEMFRNGSLEGIENLMAEGEIYDIVYNPKSAQPPQDKYEYHYDHTDCIWYRPEARNRCPSTCAQYRDGWNDAMNYIFRDGEGYRPYRRDEPYEK